MVSVILLESMALPVTFVATDPTIPVIVVPMMKPTVVTGTRAVIVGAATTAAVPPKRFDKMIDVQFRFLSTA